MQNLEKLELTEFEKSYSSRRGKACKTDEAVNRELNVTRSWNFVQTVDLAWFIAWMSFKLICIFYGVISLSIYDEMYRWCSLTLLSNGIRLCNVEWNGARPSAHGSTLLREFVKEASYPQTFTVSILMTWFLSWNDYVSVVIWITFFSPFYCMPMTWR